MASVALAIPSLDQGRFLGQAIESVFAQRAVDVELAVVDGGSRDDSVSVLKQYESRLRYRRSAPDAGQAAAINEGLKMLVDSKYVGWLNADDVLLPTGLERMVRHLEARPECVAVFGRAHIIDERGEIIGAFPTRPFSRRALARRNIVCQPASLISRRAWAAVGGLDEALHMCLDYDLWWRLSGLGLIEYLPEFVACSRDHPATKTRTGQSLLYREAFAVLRRHVGYVPWPWCLHQSAYGWRATHGGQRAADPVSQLVCVWRAMVRYAQENGSSGVARALRRCD